MKTNEANKKWKTWLTLGTLGAVAGSLGLASPVLAAIPSGDFHGSFQSANGSNTADADILIQTVSQDGVPMSYGLVLRNRNQASLYQIEDVGDGTEAWVRIVQTDEGIVGSNVDDTATYSGVVTQNGSQTQITLNPNGNGPCTETVSVSTDGGMSWLSLPTNGSTNYSGGNGSLALASQNGEATLSGNFAIGNHSYSGVFALDQVIPGIAALHEESLDPDSASGRSLQRSIAAMVALVKINGFFGSSDHLELVQISNGTQACLDPVQSMNRQ